MSLWYVCACEQGNWAGIRTRSTWQASTFGSPCCVPGCVLLADAHGLAGTRQPHPPHCRPDLGWSALLHVQDRCNTVGFLWEPREPEGGSPL